MHHAHAHVTDLPAREILIMTRRGRASSFIINRNRNQEQKFYSEKETLIPKPEQKTTAKEHREKEKI